MVSKIHTNYRACHDSRLRHVLAFPVSSCDQIITDITLVRQRRDKIVSKISQREGTCTKHTYTCVVSRIDKLTRVPHVDPNEPGMDQVHHECQSAHGNEPLPGEEAVDESTLTSDACIHDPGQTDAPDGSMGRGVDRIHECTRLPAIVPEVDTKQHHEQDEQGKEPAENSLPPGQDRDPGRCHEESQSHADAIGPDVGPGFPVEIKIQVPSFPDVSWEKRIR